MERNEHARRGRLALGVVIFCSACGPVRALAVTQPETEAVRPDYEESLRALSAGYAKGRQPALDARSFNRAGWQGRTAVLNVVCANDTRARCLEALALGLNDNALVVRDHAFRILLSFEDLASRQKEDAAQAIVADDRNYRRGQGLWIVERAHKYLKNEGR